MRYHLIVCSIILILLIISDKMPALDISMIESLSRELHPTTNLMSETEVNTFSPFDISLRLYLFQEIGVEIIFYL